MYQRQCCDPRRLAGTGRLIFYQSYVNRETAFKDGLVYIQDNGVVVIKADDKTQLRRGEYRKRCAAHFTIFPNDMFMHTCTLDSVRISSKKRYNSGNLFILDLEHAPWGCGSSATPFVRPRLAKLNPLS